MGFSTIIDVLGSLIIGGLLLLILMRLNGTVTEHYYVTGSDRNLQRALAETAILIEKDFRKMGYCADPYKITETMDIVIVADSDFISYYTDVDKDENLDVMTYFVSDTNALAATKNPRDRILYRQINSDTPLMISTNITRFLLEYYDVFGNKLTSPVASPGNITHMKISMRVEDPEAYNEQYSNAYWQQVRLTSKNLRKR
ncbi:MAG: hypothetical protein MUE93_05270 [Ignavibacteriaceae bacterium]|jgi:hypothetical protein|nr:hypothetical protein [Ignavibacteriaceae bacterium]MCU0405542.1 hypothetical protein [Ignavibacteriaceae bacterium]MCU0413606.1 hypothetical protein [Ignavibacteriaceae bacterium]